MNAVPYCAVLGTHEAEKHANWAAPASALAQFLERRGLVNLAQSALLPYGWSTGLDLTASGVNWPIAGGNLFAYFVPPLRPDDRWPSNETVIVTHSHGLQVALWAAKLGLKIDRLLDIAGPVRADMADVARAARPNIRRWLHVHSDGSDRWQWLGELFDRHLGIVRAHPLADWNIAIAKVGHSGILEDPSMFVYWDGMDLVGFLKGSWR